MEMTDEIYNKMSPEERAEYDERILKLSEALASDSTVHNPKSRWRSGKRSKSPRNIASRKPVKR